MTYLAVLCDLQGRILESLRPRPDVPQLEPGGALDDLVVDGSREKLAAFLAAVRRDGLAVGWELMIPVHGEATSFQAVGAALQDRLLVLAKESYGDLVRMVDELAGSSSEQANDLRQALKDLSLKRATRGSTDVLAEMSRLNNELATAQRELARRSARLEQLNREKNELLGMAAHDLRNPLAVSLGLAEHLLRDARGALRPNHLEMLEHIRASSEHMLVLVDELLDFAKIESGTLTLAVRPTDVAALVERTIRLCRELARSKQITIALELGAAPALRHAEVDGQKLAQALTNLLTNAIKFSHPGGAVVVRLDARDQLLVVEVEDHGVGISEEQLPHLFAPFRSGRRGTGGERSTGLGLAIVRRVVRGHGGEVTVRSRVDVGTTAAITLPLRVAAADAPARRGEASKPAGSLRVLVADDDPFSGMLVARILEELGHRVEQVGDVAAAIAAVCERRFDLAVVDVEMPDGGGREIAAALREPGRRTPVLAVTGHQGERAAAVAQDFDGVLSKPTDPRELAALIVRLTS